MIARLEEQVKILNSYIQEFARENEALQSKNSDMKTTLMQNKQLLGTAISLMRCQTTTSTTSAKLIS